MTIVVEVFLAACSFILSFSLYQTAWIVIETETETDQSLINHLITCKPVSWDSQEECLLGVGWKQRTKRTKRTKRKASCYSALQVYVI